MCMSYNVFLYLRMIPNTATKVVILERTTLQMPVAVVAAVTLVAEGGM